MSCMLEQNDCQQLHFELSANRMRCEESALVDYECVRTLETNNKRIHAGDDCCLPLPLNLRCPFYSFYNAGAMRIVTQTAS